MISIFSEGKIFIKMQTVNDGKYEYNTREATKCYNNTTVVSSNYTFSLARNIIVYTPIKGENREKHFNHILYKEKNADSGGK